jgi:hypothetical protein
MIFNVLVVQLKYIIRYQALFRVGDWRGRAAMILYMYRVKGCKRLAL